MSTNQTTCDQDKEKIKHFFHTATVPELKEFIGFCRGKNTKALTELADLAQSMVNICEKQDRKAAEVTI